MNSIFETARVHNPLLYYTSISMFGLFGILLALFFVDHTQIMGINRWIKGMKFSLSIGIYCLTWAYILSFLPNKSQVNLFSLVTVVALWIEIIAIVSQAARGQLSHFNISSPYNNIVFSIMGIAIVTQTVWSLYIGTGFFSIKAGALSPSLLWGIRIAVISSAIFAFEGMIMASKLTHSVGVPDGGPGLPFLNWSTVGGDLRVAHFFGLHSLQAIPLFAALVSPENKYATLAFGIFYCLFSAMLFFNAWAGRPLF